MESGTTRPEGYANRDAEEAVLGTMILDARGCEEYFRTLAVRDFAVQEHKAVYRTMLDMRAKKQPIDLVTLTSANRSIEETAIGLMQKATLGPAFLGSYVRILKDMTARRDFIALADNIRTAAGGDEFEPARLTEKVRGYLKNLKLTDGEDVSIRTALAELVEEITSPAEENRGIRLGIQHLDRMLDGLLPGRLYVIGARPGVGKTVFGIHAALRAASGGRAVAYFNREMEKKDLVKRMAAEVGELVMDQLKPGGLPEDKWVELTEIIEKLQDMPIRLINEARTVGEIRAKVSEMHDQEEIGLIVIDYLQRFRADEKGRSRDEEIGIMSNAIKDLALDYKCPVILLSQLNRAAGMVERPTMNQLRESGNIEQDADVVVLLHRPERDELPTETHKGRFDMIRSGGGRYLEMIVDKNRHGETGIAPVGFYGAKMKYVGV